MKINHIIALLLVVAFTFTSCKTKSPESTSPHKTEKLNWLSVNDLEAAMKVAPKPVLIDVYTKWCGPCKMLDKKTFSDPEVQKVFAENFHIVKFDAEGGKDITFRGKTYTNPKYVEGKRGRNGRHEASSLFNVRGYPTMVIMDKDFKIVDKLVGFRDANQLLTSLEKYTK